MGNEGRKSTAAAHPSEPLNSPTAAATAAAAAEGEGAEFREIARLYVLRAAGPARPTDRPSDETGL